MLPLWTDRNRVLRKTGVAGITAWPLHSSPRFHPCHGACWSMSSSSSGAVTLYMDQAATVGCWVSSRLASLLSRSTRLCQVALDTAPVGQCLVLHQSLWIVGSHHGAHWSVSSSSGGSVSRRLSGLRETGFYARPESRVSLLGRSTCHHSFVLATAPFVLCPVLHPVQIPSTGLRLPLLVVGSHHG